MDWRAQYANVTVAMVYFKGSFHEGHRALSTGDWGTPG